MNNETVIKNFLLKKEGHTPTRDIANGYYTYKGRTLATDGQQLINYNVVIAEHDTNGVLLLNSRKYSRTTSKIQSQIKRLAEQQGFKIKEYNV